MGKINKSRTADKAAGGIIKTKPESESLRFSFRFFDPEDTEVCPAHFPNGYVQALACRLKELEAWKVEEFQTKKSQSIRNHVHDWSKTTRPKGFSKLPLEWSGYSGWQFCLSANKHGRVHGVISGAVFYVVWLDCNHALYP